MTDPLSATTRKKKGNGSPANTTARIEGPVDRADDRRTEAA
jgi:hypothetical protein